MARGKHSGNGHERLHITETPDVSHIKNLDVTHEASDVSVSGILKFVMALTALGVVVFVLMWGMFRLLNAQETQKEPPPGPMAMNPEQRLPPEPRLQAAPGFEVKLKSGEFVKLEKREPEAEYRVLLGQWERELNCSPGPEAAGQSGHETGAAGTPDKESHAEASGQDARAPRIASAPPAGCVPIKDAMQKVIGLPSRVKTISEEGPGWRAEDYGIDRPTAASSGRATERGKE
jgi:hypothetical protein